jgi:hypothetical protein
MMTLGIIFKLERDFDNLCLPCFFYIAVDMLAILIARAKEDGQVGSLLPHLIEGGLYCNMPMT